MGNLPRKIYLDCAATTPLDPKVLGVMLPYFKTRFGNPGSLHSFGQEALAAVDAARAKVAAILGVGFREIIFTGSATEANNLALRGAVKRFREEASKRGERGLPKIVVSAIEHDSVLATARDLARTGEAEVQYLPLNTDGHVNIEVLKDMVDDRTAIVSVMYVSNEVGSIQPIQEIARHVRAARRSGSAFPLFHTDAVQAFAYCECNLKKMDVDLLTLSAHKLNGPKGVGALVTHAGVAPILTGGWQEFGMRSGTENVAGIVGCAEAIVRADALRAKEVKRVGQLRTEFFAGLKKIARDVQINGCTDSMGSGQSDSSPHILNVFFPAHFAEDLLVACDQKGIAVSSGAACSARASKPSHVLRALGYTEERIVGSIRFSMGRFTMRRDIQEALQRLSVLL